MEGIVGLHRIPLRVTAGKELRYARPKIADMRRIIDDRKLSVELEVDGGTNAGNAREIVKAGADVLVAGNSVFKAKIRRDRPGVTETQGVGGLTQRNLSCLP